MFYYESQFGLIRIYDWVNSTHCGGSTVFVSMTHHVHTLTDAILV